MPADASVLPKGKTPADAGRKTRPPFRDVLLYLSAYPETASAARIAEAVRLCAMLGKHICAVVEEPSFDIPVNPLAAGLGAVAAVEADQDRRAAAARAKVIASFNAAVKAAPVTSSSVCERSRFGRLAGEHVAHAARVHDLCVIPYLAGEDGQRSVAKAALFDGGRPVLLVPPACGQVRLDGSVLIAWDGGRASARAVADAMPLLERAADVVILTITGARRAPPHRNSEPLLEHLARHGVKASAREMDAQGSSEEEALVRGVEAGRPDLLVMGGYGRSPAGELLLGGMTERLLQRPPIPVFLSH